MTLRLRLALVAGAIVLSGCGDELTPRYQRNESAYIKVKLTPKLRQRVTKVLNDTFGERPDRIKAPTGIPLPENGAYLAGYVTGPWAKNQDLRLGYVSTPGPRPGTAYRHELDGGYALYRRHCLHCHGSSGDGLGPTAEFLWPRPRDYRRGVFKFTRTEGVKPTRDDLRRTVRDGIANSSMPAFETMMTPEQIEQVIDYAMFLAIRGETEIGLMREAETIPEEEVDKELTDARALEIAEEVFAMWREADSQVINPPLARTRTSPESIARGKEMFLGLTKEKLQCAGCHGNQARGNGPSFIAEDIYNQVVFGGDPETLDTRLKDVLNDVAHGEKARFDELMKLWVDGSLDDWGLPIRPANLNNGPNTTYKGGRRPIDIYWRIAKGINGAKMPAHAGQITPPQIWDLVNFVLALPYQPDLLKDVPPVLVAPAAAVARR